MGLMSPTRAYSLDRMPPKQGLEFEEPLLIHYPRLRGVHWPRLSPQREVLVLFFLLCGLVLSLTSPPFQSSPLLGSAFTVSRSFARLDTVRTFIMDKTNEIHALGNYALQKRGNVSEYTILEEDDRDRVNLAKVGKKQVLKVRDFPDCTPE